MMEKVYKIFQYPRGVNRGGILDIEYSPTISCSHWENNCMLVEYEDTDMCIKGEGGDN